MANNRLLSALGLATKAGKTASGEFSTEKALKEGSACLVLVASDSSDNTKKHFRDMCSYREVPYYEISDKLGLGAAMGKEMRASLAVTDPGFAQMMIRVLDTDMQ